MRRLPPSKTEYIAVGEKNAAVIAVKGEIDTEEPKVTTPGQAIYSADTNACRVHLYENGSEVKSYPCTPGKSGYSTPKGDWKLSYKDASPTWYNPHSEWAADMPESIRRDRTTRWGCARWRSAAVAASSCTGRRTPASWARPAVMAASGSPTPTSSSCRPRQCGDSSLSSARRRRFV